MLYARFQHGGAVMFGVYEDGVLRPIKGHLFGKHTLGRERIAMSEARLLAPVVPGKILAAAVNYPSHVTSARAVLKEEEAPAIPQLFLKPSSSIIGPDETIVLPAEARRVDAEGELVAVIGKRCRSARMAEALDCVFGYTCGNDVSARHWQRDDIQWWRAKGSDTFSPIGPFITTGLDPSDLELCTRVNGEEKQRTNTSALVHSLEELIGFASQVMTLEPGDLVFTGTPGVTPAITSGDTVEVEIEGIGVLRNPVVGAGEG